jgi:hypothetical protein
LMPLEEVVTLCAGVFALLLTYGLHSKPSIQTNHFHALIKPNHNTEEQ